MQRKRNLITNEITKHKAKLNIHGGKQVYGMNYFETYAPVVTLYAVLFLICLGMILSWNMRQIDFGLAYPQALIEHDMYTELPPGIETKHSHSNDYVLKLLAIANLYGQKQASRVWNQYLVNHLLQIGFKQSLIDECVFYKGNIIFVVYVDDSIFFGSDDETIMQIITITQMQNLGMNIEDQGHTADYVGVNIKKLKNSTYKFTQKALVDAIISDVDIGDAYINRNGLKVVMCV